MKDTIKVIRGNKFIIPRSEKWLEDSAKIYTKTYNKVIRKYFPWLKQQELDDSKKRGNCFSVFDIILKTQTGYVEYDGKKYKLLWKK